MNIYVELTHAFNRGGVKAILGGGQAVVLHRLAVMSKDGDWILREDDETMTQVLSVLAGYGARYRYGAPLDIRWLAGGWSAHLEFPQGGLRVRTDFVTRPPRMDGPALQKLWREQVGAALPFVGARDLADLKKTNREKDYVVIGELARILTEPEDQMLYSRSARDLMQLAAEHPDQARVLAEQRPALAAVWKGVRDLEAALDAERRNLMHANEERLGRYLAAAERWAANWPGVAREMEGLPLAAAHRVMSGHALNLLPQQVAGAPHA
jgi:hypothetical protein